MIWLRMIALRNNFDVISWKLFRPGAGYSEIVLPRLPLVGLLNLNHLAGRSSVEQECSCCDAGDAREEWQEMIAGRYSMRTRGSKVHQLRRA